MKIHLPIVRAASGHVRLQLTDWFGKVRACRVVPFVDSQVKGLEVHWRFFAPFASDFAFAKGISWLTHAAQWVMKAALSRGQDSGSSNQKRTHGAKVQ
jgi:hypothetical protein